MLPRLKSTDGFRYIGGRTTLFLIIFLLFFQNPLHAAALSGRVVGVHDGDTLTLLDANRHQTKIRLAEIDTPESAQPYGSRAKQALSDLVFGKNVVVEVREKDRYGRSVGRIYVGDTDVNAAMVASGAAWVYRQYSHDPELLRLETEARTAGRGLWSLPEAQRTPPWEWRQQQRQGGTQPVTQNVGRQTQTGTSPNYSCAGKTTCGQMTSCEEARIYLQQCGLSRLDGDHDGIPCESLCRNRAF